ncbi:hypothetical protein EYF80_002851 [Liparis tanakae]|uniref:Uncharacterized protein n=1 Tax=Liparis tanakae TaxID=230148 RepID=A0A4Z2JA98_9TELE|nr:hypothetical protein EYF80_002851 [Liparis tanakae]
MAAAEPRETTMPTTDVSGMPVESDCKLRKWKSSHVILSLSSKPAACIIALMPASAWLFGRAPFEISMKDLQRIKRAKMNHQTCNRNLVQS